MFARTIMGSLALASAMAGCQSSSPPKVDAASVSSDMTPQLQLQLESDPASLTVDLMPSTQPRARTVSLQFSVTNTGGSGYEARPAEELVRFWAEQSGRQVWESRIPANSAKFTIAAGSVATFGTTWSITDTSVFAKDSKVTLFAQLVPAGLSTARTLPIGVVH